MNKAGSIFSSGGFQLGGDQAQLSAATSSNYAGSSQEGDKAAGPAFANCYYGIGNESSG